MINAPTSNCILIVDDEQDFANGLARLITARYPDATIRIANSAPKALEILAASCVQLLITDLRMPEMTGMELINRAIALSPDLSMVVLTAHGTIETAVEALKVGAYDFLTKPIEPQELFRTVEKGLERSRLLNENRRLRMMVEHQDAAGELIGEAPSMQHLRHSIAAVAQSDYTVLVRGESGTGKEMVARMVHKLSLRTANPFLAINCPAIPEHLLESELFGHVKGAFTGADKDRKGLFASANGGTLHMDEIGDISPAIQTKLLRVLQEGEVRPVGSSKNEKVDVRVVASTNQDLEHRIADKSFREDLYYRLNVLTVTIPPLRDRVSDIPLLTHHFLRQTCREMKQEEKGIDPDVVEFIASKQWPGNVRELQNYVRRLTVFCTGDTVDMSLVRLVEQGPLPDTTRTESGGQGLPPYKDAKNRVIEDFTHEYVHDLLTTSKGNISEAARLSGLSRVALQKILSRMEIDAAQFRHHE